MSPAEKTASSGATTPRLRLLLTADYEVFGDGGGCVERCLIEPSRELMEICEAAATRVTFFVDVCEYWAFKRAEDRCELPAAYRPATWIEQQLASV